MAIGLDIGGSKIRGILLKNNKIVKEKELLTPSNLQEFESIIKIIINYLGINNKVYIGAAGITERNKIINSPNIKYLNNYNFKKLNIKVESIKNDALCFAAGEYYSNKKVKAKNVLFLTIGTGIGRAVAKNGELKKIKKLEKPEDWEEEYQKLRDTKNNEQLAQYLKDKIKTLTEEYSSQLVIIGGGISRRKGFYQELKKVCEIDIKKSYLGKNAVALGAIKKVKK